MFCRTLLSLQRLHVKHETWNGLIIRKNMYIDMFTGMIVNSGSRVLERFVIQRMQNDNNCCQFNHFCFNYTNISRTGSRHNQENNEHKWQKTALTYHRPKVISLYTLITEQISDWSELLQSMNRQHWYEQEMVTQTSQR